MRAIVTGAAGFIGSHLADRLLREGWEVRGIDRLAGYYEPAVKRSRLDRLGRHADFDAVEADLNETDLESVLDGADVIFHLAAQPGARGGWGAEFERYVRDNVLATQRLLEAAREVRALRRFVFASSSSVYGEADHYPTTESREPHPISPYGATKLVGEHLCRLYRHQEQSVPAVILRYFTVFGPGQRPDMAISRFLDAALTGRPVEIFGDGMQGRDFTYVDDAVAATIAAAERGRPGAVYNITGGSHATVLELIAMIGALLGRSLQLVHLPGAAGDVRNTAGEKTLAHTELGFDSRVSLEEGLRRQLQAHLGARGSDRSDRVAELLQ
jgi:UDP-glucuronate 4-epimerase